VDLKAVIERLRARKEWRFFGVLPTADRPLAIAWWLVHLNMGLVQRHRVLSVE
jgi:ATP-binding cassette subfamily B protein